MPLNARNPESGQGLWFDTANTAVSLEYDIRNRGILIALTPATAGSESATHWWIDWESKSLWKLKLGDADYEPFCLHARKNFIAASQAHSTVVWGCRDGYVRRLNNTLATDDGTAYTSYVWIGPIMDGLLINSTMVAELIGVLDSDSGAVTWSLHVGDTPQQAFEAAAKDSGRWEAGRNYVVHPRLAGQAIYLKITGTGNWGLEGIAGKIIRQGKVRV